MTWQPPSLPRETQQDRIVRLQGDHGQQHVRNRRGSTAVPLMEDYQSREDGEPRPIRVVVQLLSLQRPNMYSGAEPRRGCPRREGVVGQRFR